jgi:hypothetical protein
MSNGTSGISVIVAPPASPARTAMCPALRPITSTTITRSWASAVVCSRSIAAVQMCTAVSKPNVISVAAMSLSIVFGTPMQLTPSSCRSRAAPSEPSPPITMNPSSRWRAIVAFTSSTPSGSWYGCTRDVPRIVPPRGRMPRHRLTSRTSHSSSRTPRQASRKPTTVPPWTRSTFRTTARITALRPGQSPPEVSMPIRTDLSVEAAGRPAERPAVGRPSTAGPVACRGRHVGRAARYCPPPWRCSRSMPGRRGSGPSWWTGPGRRG